MSALLQRLTSPPKQTLWTLQPTPSTIKYTVSTRPVPKTLVARAGRYVGIVLRVVIALCVLVFLWTKWQITFEKQAIVSLQRWISRNSNTTMANEFLKLAKTSPWHYIAPAAIVVLFLVFRRGYTGTYLLPSLSASIPKSQMLILLAEESLTILSGLGVQTSTSSATYLQTPATRFIPTTSIQDIFIHEAFKGFEVRFYLAIVVEGEDNVVVVFPKLLPRRAVLEEVWRGAKKCLWEGGTAREKEKGRGIVKSSS